MSDEPKPEDEPEVAAPPHAVECEAEAAPTLPGSEDLSPTFPSSVTPGLDPGAEREASTPAQHALAAEGPVLGSSPRMTEKSGKARADAERRASTPKRRLRWGRALLVILVLLIFWPPLSVLALKIVPPPFTILMVERLVQGRGLDKSWRSLDRIAPSLPLAVIAAEDAKFCEHDGFDWDAIRIAQEHNARSPAKVRGGSTISQQTAKNVFLWPSRDYVRKGLEAGYTVLIEHIWGKRRILEAYLNVVEWGPGLYGAQAAAQRYFHEDASRLSPEQSSRLAAILPSPLKWKAVNPGRYVVRRSRRIGANAQLVRTDDLAWCVRR